jgi:hypothetical protein
MTAAKKKDPNRRLKPDAILETLTQGSEAPPNLKMLIGVIGRATRVGYWRLYVNAYLTEYFEFLGEDVYRHHRMPSESPLGDTIVWLKATAEILRTSSTPSAAAKEFLDGEIAQAIFSMPTSARTGLGGRRAQLTIANTLNCANPSAGTCTLVACTRVPECAISREANPCA